MAETNEDIKVKVMSAVGLLRLKPTQLIDLLRGHGANDVQDAMQELIFSGRLVLSNDRYLEIPVALTQ